MTRAYATRFANAADFSFLIVGTFDQAAITPLIEQYIGALPSTGKRVSTDKPLNFVFPAAVERISVAKGKEQKSDTVITFFSDTGGKVDEETIADGAASLLQIRLRDLLREDLGGTYSVSADYSNMLPSPGLRHLDDQLRQLAGERREAHRGRAGRGEAPGHRGPDGRGRGQGARAGEARARNQPQAERLLARRPADADRVCSATRRCSPRAASASRRSPPSA